MAVPRNPNRSFYRRGPEHRFGEIINFAEIRKRYDSRSIEIGRWVTRDENEQAAAHFYDALGDLMAILNGPEQLISLRGTLAFQYGIGGRPGVAAHYTPATRCFALAKRAVPCIHGDGQAVEQSLFQPAGGDVRPRLRVFCTGSADHQSLSGQVHPLIRRGPPGTVSAGRAAAKRSPGLSRLF